MTAGGPRTAGSLGAMPAQGTLAGGDLTDDEILAVVCHERYTLGGADPGHYGVDEEADGIVPPFDLATDEGE